MQYTTEQQAIIDHTNGHARIIAVAGSGKTQTLTAYVKQRLDLGANPRRLLVLMYNKAAQIDFEKRLKQSLVQVISPDIRTFHSLGYRICQTLVRQGDMPAFNKNLLTDGEIESAVWRILRHLADENIADDVLARKKKWVEPAVAYFELIKSSLASPETVFDETGLPAVCRFYIDAFYRFEDWRSDQNKLTFSDLIYEPIQRFKREAHLAKQFSGHMAEIIVDEFQDINPAQHYLLEVIAGDVAQVMVVGDPDQTIYEFRGSKPSLLTQTFSERFTPLTDFQLSRTFRFGDGLSLLANQVIAGNYQQNQRRTQCITHDTTQATQVSLLPMRDSAQGVLQTIKRWSAAHPLSDIAVINRLWANSARLELLLLANGIPFHLDNHQTVLERHELRPFRVLLQIASGQSAEWDLKTRRLAWQSLLTQPFVKVKKAIIDQLVQSLAHVPTQWGQALRNAVPTSLTKYQSDALFERARWIEKAERGVGDAYPVIHGWLQGTDYLAALNDNAFSAAAVEEQVATVKAFAMFVRQQKWLLASGAEHLAEMRARKTPSGQDALLITSIHKSKGREWPCVIIPEVNDRFYPYQPDGEMSISASVESERRLLYVAMTRAQSELVLVTPGGGSELAQSPLLPAAYVLGLPAFERWLAEPESTPALPSGMHKASVEFYAQQKNLGDIDWHTTQQTDALLKTTVRHPDLGVGLITREDETRVFIQFIRDGRLREFDRALVLPMLEILPE